MRANSIHLQRIFEQTIRYEIPLFQRPYVWEEETNWQPLWEDVRSLTERYLRNGAVHPHFLGAIVLDQLRRALGSIETRQVIDGQQRLTTLQLLLAALRDLSRAHDAQRHASRFEQLTRNHESFVDRPEDALKVWPTNLDREAFATTLAAGSPEVIRKHYGHSPSAQRVGLQIPNAYLYFTRMVNGWLSGADDEGGDGLADFGLEDRLDALWAVVRGNLLLVVIDLDEDDDAQVIFETLNARGTRLLPADLVKNYLFHRAERERLAVEPLYERYWRHFDSGFWRKEVKQGRLKRPRIDLFLRHYLTLVTNDEVGDGHIFGTFRFYAEQHLPSVSEDQETAAYLSPAEAHLEALRIYGGVYRSFDEAPPGSRAALFFERLAAIDTTTVYPFLLESFRSLTADTAGTSREMDQILVWLESYLVRRMLCGLSAKNYNRLFLDLVRAASRAGSISADFTQEYLARLSGESTRWPDDQEFRESWMNRPVYQLLAQYKVRMVLQALDRACEDGKSEALPLPDALTIEHVLPQSWEAHWPLGLDDPDDPVEHQRRAEARTRALHTFGNLSLITSKLNPSLSNGAWTDKRRELVKFSRLNLNRWFHEVELWDEAAIQARGEHLFRKAVAIWPHPG